MSIRRIASGTMFVTIAATLAIAITSMVLALAGWTHETRYYGPNNLATLWNYVSSQGPQGHTYFSSGAALASTNPETAISAIASRSIGQEYCINIPQTQRWDSGWNNQANTSWAYSNGSTSSWGYCLPDLPFEIRHRSYGYWFDPLLISPYVEKNFHKTCMIVPGSFFCY